jgi:hypothetical protein
MKIYRHYGSNKFRKELVVGKYIIECFKPGGLWGSPIDSKWGWKDYCESEEFKLKSLKKHFDFTLKEDTKILEVRHLEDVVEYGIQDDLGFDTLDYHRINDEYDAMEVYMCDYWNDLHYSNIFYTWDVDSIVVWNPEVIIPL